MSNRVPPAIAMVIASAAVLLVLHRLRERRRGEPELALALIRLAKDAHAVHRALQRHQKRRRR